MARAGILRPGSPHVTIPCPHCRAVNPPDSRFCAGCGKAMPPAAASRPVIVGAKAFASSAPGRMLQLGELHRRARTARNALFGLGLLQLILGGALFAVGSVATDPEARRGLTFIGAAVGIIGVIFIALGAWAGRNPLPAALCGLVLYCTLAIGDALASPATLIQGIVIKVIIIAILAKAVSAGVRHRQLKKHLLQLPQPAHA